MNSSNICSWRMRWGYYSWSAGVVDTGPWLSTGKSCQIQNGISRDRAGSRRWCLLFSRNYSPFGLCLCRIADNCMLHAIRMAARKETASKSMSPKPSETWKKTPGWQEESKRVMMAYVSILGKEDTMLFNFKVADKSTFKLSKNNPPMTILTTMKLSALVCKSFTARIKSGAAQFASSSSWQLGVVSNIREDMIRWIPCGYVVLDVLVSNYGD